MGRRESWNDNPQVWFGVLREAVAANDLERGREAQAELRRLGIEVNFTPQYQLARARQLEETVRRLRLENVAANLREQQGGDV